MNQLPQAKQPLSKPEFDAIYAKVPRLTVEVLIKNTSGQVLLTKRAIEPAKGSWHLPGGTVRMGEPLIQAVERVAAAEVGLKVKAPKLVGYIEYPKHWRQGFGYPVGIVFEVTDFTGQPQLDEEASAWDWFSQLPSKMHADQDGFLVAAGYLKP